MSSLKKQDKKAPAPKIAPKAPAIPGAAKKETAAKKPAAPAKPAAKATPAKVTPAKPAPAATKKPASSKPAPAALPKKTLPKLAPKPAAVRKEKPARPHVASGELPPSMTAPEAVAAPESAPVSEATPSAPEAAPALAAPKVFDPSLAVVDLGSGPMSPAEAVTAMRAEYPLPPLGDGPATPKPRRKRDAGRTVRSAVAEYIAAQHLTDPEIMAEIAREFPAKAINAQIIGACRSELNSGKRTAPGYERPAGGYEQIVFTVVTGDAESVRIKRSEKPASERKPRNARPKYAPGEDPLEKLGFVLTPTKRKPAARKRLAPAPVAADSETAGE